MFKKINYRTLPIVVVEFTHGFVITEVLCWIDFLKGFYKRGRYWGHLRITAAIVHY